MTTARAQLLQAAGESGNDRVIAGRNGFLFLADTLDDYMGKNVMTDEEISRLCGNVLAFSQALSGRLIVLIAPDKAAIYPENMPVRYLKGRGESSLDRVQQALLKGGITVLDAKNLLLAGKEEGQLYFSRDTHWNARGARNEGNPPRSGRPPTRRSVTRRARARRASARATCGSSSVWGPWVHWGSCPARAAARIRSPRWSGSR